MKSGRALFISAYLPSTNVPAAGNRLSGSALEDYASRFETVDVVSFCNATTRDFERDFKDYPNTHSTLFNITKSRRLGAMLRHPLLPSGVAVRRYLAASHVRDLLARHQYDEIFVDFIQALGIVDDTLWPKVHLRLHDVMLQLYRRQGKELSPAGLIGRVETARCAGWEPDALRRVGRLSCLTEKDADIIRGFTGPRQIDIAPPSGFFVVKGRVPAGIDPHMILFWGNMSRKENVDAVLHFTRNLLPAIRAEIPEARLVAAGANPPQSAMEATGGDVTWTGFVDTPDELFLSCGIGVAPLLSGAGVKIKVLEFLHSGIPTVATMVGAEGIPADPLLHVHDDDASFIRTCISLIREAERTSRA